MSPKEKRIQLLVLAAVLTIGALLLGSIIALAAPSNGGRAAASVTGPTRLPKVVQGFNEQIAGNITINEDTVTTEATGSFNERDLWLRISQPTTGVAFSFAPDATLTAGAGGNRRIETATVANGMIRIPISESTPTTEPAKRLLGIAVSDIRYDVTSTTAVGTVTVEVLSSDTTPTASTPVFDSAPNARVVAGAATLFPDVQPNLPGFFAAPAISFLKLRTVVNGYPDGTFRPQNNITRAEFVKMVVEVRDLTLPTTFTAPFPDVPVSDWSARYIAAAKAANIAMGYTDGSFRPDRPISRAEMAAFIVRAGGFAINTTGPTFPDVPSNHWAFNVIMTARNNNLITGFPDGTYRPNAMATRAEASVIIFNWSD